MATHDKIELTRAEIEGTGVIYGEITCVDYHNETVDVEIDSTVYQGVSVHYHCTETSTANGHMAFSIGDEVILLNLAPNDEMAVGNLTVIGFADGYPWMCAKRMILYSVVDGNPSIDFTASKNVLWSVDDEEIIMGPCSLVALQTAGYIESLDPLVLRGRSFATGDLVYSDSDDPSFTANNNCFTTDFPSPGDMDNALVWIDFELDPEDPDPWIPPLPPDYSDSCGSGTTTVEITDARCYNGSSPTEITAATSETMTGSYTTCEIIGIVMGWDPQPSHYIVNYEFEKVGTSTWEKIQCLCPCFTRNEDLSLKDMAGAFSYVHIDSSWDTTVAGNSKWITSCDFSFADINARYRVATEDEDKSIVSRYYSPLGLFGEYETAITEDSTAVIYGTQDPVTTGYSSSATENVFEINVYSAQTAMELRKTEEGVVYEKIGTAVYVLSGEVQTSTNGSLSGVEAIEPKVHVSVDVVTHLETEDFNPFESSNIGSLAGALETALVNSDGGESIGTYFFKGKL